MNDKKFRFLSMVMALCYIVLISIFIFNLIKLPEQSKEIESEYISDAEKALKLVLESEIEDMPSKSISLIEEYPMELVIQDDEKNSIYKTVNFTAGSYIGTVNKDAILEEATGSFNKGQMEIKYWFSLYQMSNDQYLEGNIIKQSMLLTSAFFVVSIGFYFIWRTLLTPLKRVRESVSKLENYEFEELSDSADNVNRELEAFAKHLQNNIHAVSRKHTELEQQLQLERERLSNTIIVSKSFVHDLKTPVHQAILENEQALHKKQLDAYEIAGLNIQMNEKLMKTVNEILVIMKGDFYNIQAEVSRVDFIDVVVDTIKVFSKSFDEKGFALDFISPEVVSGYYNQATVQLLVHNLLSNMVQYAKENSKLTIQLDNIDNHIQLIFENESASYNIERMKNSEQLFNAIQLEDSEEHVYSSGNGLFLIKDLAQLLGGQYELQIENEKVTIIILLPEAGDKK
ncbi:MAG: sensor histidine kinase [Coprobacillaceae bacterium]